MISVQSICACLTALVLIRYLLDGIGELVIGAPATHVNFGGALRRPREFVHISTKESLLAFCSAELELWQPSIASCRPWTILFSRVQLP